MRKVVFWFFTITVGLAVLLAIAGALAPTQTADKSKDLAALLKGPAEGKTVEKRLDALDGQQVEFDGYVRNTLSGDYGSPHSVVLVIRAGTADSPTGPRFAIAASNKKKLGGGYLDEDGMNRVRDVLGHEGQVHVTARMSNAAYDEDEVTTDRLVYLDDWTVEQK